MHEPSAEQKLDETSDVSKSGEKSIDGELMVNEQIQGTLQQLERIEIALQEEASGLVFKSSGYGVRTEDMPSVLRGRRRSTGNVSAAHLAQLLKNDTSQSGLNESKDDSQQDKNLTHSQIINLQNVLNKKAISAIDQSMMTEFEYLNFLQSNNMQDTMNESSFCKGILSIEKSGASAHKDA